VYFEIAPAKVTAPDRAFAGILVSVPINDTAAEKVLAHCLRKAPTNDRVPVFVVVVLLV